MENFHNLIFSEKLEQIEVYESDRDHYQMIDQKLSVTKAKYKSLKHQLENTVPKTELESVCHRIEHLESEHQVAFKKEIFVNRLYQDYLTDIQP